MPLRSNLCRSLLALFSDRHGTRTGVEYLPLINFLATTRPTPMGDGIRIEFANGSCFLGGSGLSFYIDGTRPSRIVYEDRDCGPLNRNSPDHTGGESVSLPLRRPDFPHIAP